MIRIAFGITDLDPGGAEHILAELATRLDRSQFSPSVVCLQRPGAIADRLVRAGVPVRSLEMRSPRHVPMALWRWRRIFRAERPVILQTFLFHANLLGRLAARMAGVPFVVGGIRVAERRYRWPMWIDRLTHSWADRYVCVSEAVRGFAIQHARIAAERLEVIPNGVDVSRFDLAGPVDLSAHDVPVGCVTLLFLGRLDVQKGLDDLLAALELLARRMRLADRLRVLLLGSGPLQVHLESSIRQRALQHVVRLAGWQPKPEAWLAAADGLILPSRWEGMPNVVLEAMASRLAVIATAVEGSSELIRPGQTGWLVPPGDPPALADAIEEFLDDPTRRRQFGQAGRALVERDYTLERMVRAYESLYHSLIARGPGAG